MKKKCTGCEKEVILQEVKNNFSLCYLCNFDLSNIKELKSLKIDDKAKSEKIKQATVKINETNPIQNETTFKSVKVIDFDMPFSSMVIFMVKWSIASIPAMIIIMILTFFIFSLIGIPFTMFK